MIYCRCGHDGNGHHPCHGSVYTCRQPAKIRFITNTNATVGGSNVKLIAKTTFACDDCWNQYKQIVKV